MRKFISSRLRLLIELLPNGHDIFLSINRKRMGISYRGIYSTYAQAMEMANKTLRDYDVVNRNKANNQAQEEALLDNPLRDYDYPLLYWVSRLLLPGTRLLELGGSIGNFYFSSKKYFSHPDAIQWTIVELEAAVTLGNEIAERRGEKALKFIESDIIQHADGADIFVTAGTIQYMEKDLDAIVASLPKLPNHVLVNYLPAHDNKAFWTLQYLEVCEVPYRVYSKKKLEISMSKLGYELVDAWRSARKLEIPFHQNLALDHYSGLYFRLSGD
jgi:putative methyltransferase (TIGR04325 family)